MLGFSYCRVCPGLAQSGAATEYTGKDRCKMGAGEMDPRLGDGTDLTF